MLRPVIFVGCGGSGVRTVHKIRAELERQLRERRYTGKFPQSWQFITVDVPSTNQAGQGGSSEVAYVNLAEADTKYKGPNSADQAMLKDDARRADFVQWRPNPETVNVTLTIGAGQYRAVGRVAASHKGLKSLGDRVKQAAVKCIDDGVTLADVCRAFDIDVPANATQPQPYVVLISSLGGGAGSGIFLDVADTIRLAAEGATPWLKSGLIGVLYDPSVFDTGLEDVARKGIPGNTLAAVSEMVAGQWAPWDVAPYIAASAGELGTYAGLEYAFLVGSSNGEAVMTSADEAYTATSRALVAWTLDPSISGRMDEVTLGNWAAEDANSQLPLHVSEGNSARMPFSALGYSRVDLGRRRFAIYAEERLAREALSMVISRHMTPQVASGQITPEEAAAQRVRDSNFKLVNDFLNACQLNEHSEEGGVDNNQVLDAIRADDFLADECPRLKKKVLDKITDRNKRLQQFEGAVVEELTGFPDAAKRKHEQRAVEWAKDVQVRVIAQTLSSISLEGLLVTQKLLAEVCERVGKTFPDQLVAEKGTGKLRTYAETWKNRKNAKELTDSKAKMNRAATDKASSLLDFFFTAEVERDLHDVVADVLKDMAENLLGPIRDALERASQLVNAEVQSKEFSELSSADVVAQRLMPAKTEMLVEPPEEFSRRFDELIAASAGTVEQSIANVIEGRLLTDIPIDQLPVQVQPLARWSPWVPKVAQGLLQPQAAAQASLDFAMSTEDVRRRAQYWLVTDPTRPIGEFISTTLADYLNDARLSEPKRKERIERFCTLLRASFAKSNPLADVQWNWTAAQFGVQKEDGFIRYMSPIPLSPPTQQAVGAGVSAANEIGKVLSSALNTDSVSGYFAAGSATYVDIFSMLRPLPPSAFLSLSKPIIESKAFFDTRRPSTWVGDEFWLNRRSRPLLESIPLMPAVRLTLARGWLTGLMTNRLRFGVSEGANEVDLTKQIKIATGDGHTLGFSHPPIGSLSAAVPVHFRKAAGLSLVLVGALYAEMVAATNGERENLDALIELLKLGTGAGDGIPCAAYGAGLHPALKKFVDELPTDGDKGACQLLAEELELIEKALVDARSKWDTPGAAWTEYPPHLAISDLYRSAAQSLRGALTAYSNNQSADSFSGRFGLV